MAAARKTTRKKSKAASATTKKKSRPAASKKKTTTKSRTQKKTTAARRPTKTKTKSMAKSVKKTTKSRPARASSKPKASAAATNGDDHKKTAAPAKQRPVKRPAFDAEFLKSIRDTLVDDRRQLLSMLQSTQAQLADRETGLADLSDIASGGFEDELALGIMANEAATLDKIDAAIRRIDDDTYGICIDCDKPIPKKRLEFLPFALRCMECEGNRERRVRMGAIED